MEPYYFLRETIHSFFSTIIQIWPVTGQFVEIRTSCKHMKSALRKLVRTVSNVHRLFIFLFTKRKSKLKAFMKGYRAHTHLNALLLIVASRIAQSPLVILLQLVANMFSLNGNQ